MSVFVNELAKIARKVNENIKLVENRRRKKRRENMLSSIPKITNLNKERKERCNTYSRIYKRNKRKELWLHDK